MNRKTKRLAVTFFIAMCLGGNTGCQLDLTGHMGSKAFYPDNVGNKEVGDPRRPMYEGSGYAERLTSGGETNAGFPSLKLSEGGAQ